MPTQLALSFDAVPVTCEVVNFRRAVLIFIISLSRPLSESSRSNNSFRLRGNKTE